jgi:hypothetical protein
MVPFITIGVPGPVAFEAAGAGASAGCVVLVRLPPDAPVPLVPTAMVPLWWAAPVPFAEPFALAEALEELLSLPFEELLAVPAAALSVEFVLFNVAFEIVVTEVLETSLLLSPVRSADGCAAVADTSAG